MAMVALLWCLLLISQTGCITGPVTDSRLHPLQGYWEGDGPSGKITITIKGNELYFRAREDFWYETRFALPVGTLPKQLHATIEDSSPPATAIGQMVFAIYKIEGATLTLAVDDGSDEPPRGFADASSRYTLTRVQY